LKILAEKNGLNRAAKLCKCSVSGMRQPFLRETAENRLGFRCSKAECSRILDHLVILLANEISIDRL
jgi:hypothetical protein